MNHRAHRRLIYAQTKRDRSYEDAHFIAHPEFLILSSSAIAHLRVITNSSDPAVFQECDGLLYPRDRRGVNNNVASGILFYRSQQQSALAFRIAVLYVIAEIGTLETGDVSVHITQVQLLHNV